MINSISNSKTVDDARGYLESRAKPSEVKYANKAANAALEPEIQPTVMPANHLYKKQKGEC